MAKQQADKQVAIACIATNSRLFNRIQYSSPCGGHMYPQLIHGTICTPNGISTDSTIFAGLIHVTNT